MNKVRWIVGAQPTTETTSRVASYHALNLTFAVMTLLGSVMVAAYFVWSDSLGEIGIDFRASTWAPGNAILDGESIYPDPGSIRVDSWPALYPPPYMIVFAPLAFLPFSLAASIWVVVLIASIAGALWLVGLRDIRCYALAVLSLPVAAAVGAGNATGLLVLSIALLWRWRDDPHRGAAAFACGLVIKPILWPLFVWLVVTRRIRLALEAAVVTPLVVLAGWALIGFDGLANYPELLRAQSNALASNGLLTTNLLIDTGLPLVTAEGISVVIGVCLLVVSIWVQRDVERFTLGVAAALIITPVMFVHYLTILYVPLAVAFKRLSPAWFAPMALWLIAFAYEDNTRPLWTSIVGISVLVLILAFVTRRLTLSGADTASAGD